MNTPIPQTAGQVPAGQNAWEKYSPHIFQTLVRLAFWALAVAVSILPSVAATHHDPSWNLYEMASETNSAQLFRDFYYVVIVVSILEITNIMERLHHNHSNAWVWTRSIMVLAFVYFVYSVFAGTLEFMNLAHFKTAISGDLFMADIHCIYWVLGISFVTEATCGLMGPR